MYFSHRGSVSWLESAPNSSHAIACSGVDLFPYLREIQQSSTSHICRYISTWRFSFMQNCFFSASVKSSYSVCNSVAALKMSSCVSTNFNYRCLLFVPPRQSSSFQRALSCFYHCLYNIPCLSQTRGPIIEMISSPSNVHHDKHDSSDRIYSSLFIHRSMAWLG